MAKRKSLPADVPPFRFIHDSPIDRSSPFAPSPSPSIKNDPGDPINAPIPPITENPDEASD
jgi:hypothetical protein